MSTIAAKKNQEQYRRISGNRVQNENMPDPPHANLPKPDLFYSIRSRNLLSQAL